MQEEQINTSDAVSGDAQQRSLPPPPPGVRYVRPPGMSVIVSDDKLRADVDRRFHWPMIILALLVLPLLAVDFFILQKNPQLEGGWLDWMCLIALIIIWLAFLIEFVVKITIAENRFEYARRNWLDIIIIILPVLRPLRVARVARLSRVFTLRGVGMKFARYVFTGLIGLEATERILDRIGVKVNDERPDPGEMTRAQLIDEIKDLRKLADQWQEWRRQHEEYLNSQADTAHPRPAPDGENQPRES